MCVTRKTKHKAHTGRGEETRDRTGREERSYVMSNDKCKIQICQGVGKAGLLVLAFFRLVSFYLPSLHCLPHPVGTVPTDPLICRRLPPPCFSVLFFFFWKKSGVEMCMLSFLPAGLSFPSFLLRVSTQKRTFMIMRERGRDEGERDPPLHLHSQMNPCPCPSLGIRSLEFQRDRDVLHKA